MPFRPFHRFRFYQRFKSFRSFASTPNRILFTRRLILATAAAVFSIPPLFFSIPILHTKSQFEINDILVCDLVANGDLKELKKIASQVDWKNVRHPYGWTPLHVAALNGNESMVRFLLQQGMDPNSIDKYSIQLLTQGDYSYYSKGIRSRVEYFHLLDLNAKTEGFTVLHYACVASNQPTIELLLNAGANPLEKDESGHIPKDYLSPTDTSILALFETYENKFLKVLEQKEKRLRQQFPLETQLKKKIVGQDGPISAVASAIRRRQNGWQDEDHPLVFLFLGSSGIGKTELAKQLAAYIHKDNPNGFIRIDLSEFQSKHEVSKFIGSPPGYVGYEEGGQLTSKLKKTPNAVVLLDEVEKAHPDVLTIMLQLFDEGRLTDGKGKTIECKNALFIMTSNLAQQEIAEYADELRDSNATVTQSEQKETGQTNDDVPINFSSNFMRNTLYPILRKHFRRDEFLGRINDTLLFLPFSNQELKEITTMELEKWKTKADERHGMTLTWTEEAVELIALNGYNCRYGARSITHHVEKEVVSKIAKAHENDEIGENALVHVYVKDGNIEIEGRKGKGESKSWW